MYFNSRGKRKKRRKKLLQSLKIQRLFGYWLIHKYYINMFSSLLVNYTVLYRPKMLMKKYDCIIYLYFLWEIYVSFYSNVLIYFWNQYIHLPTNFTKYIYKTSIFIWYWCIEYKGGFNNIVQRDWMEQIKQTETPGVHLYLHCDALKENNFRVHLSSFMFVKKFQLCKIV